jgi:Integrase core domain
MLDERPGNCWDNAVVESFFATLKTELMRGRLYHARQEARTETFAYVEGFHNRSPADIPPWAISAPWSSNSGRLSQPAVSTKPGDDQLTFYHESEFVNCTFSRCDGSKWIFPRGSCALSQAPRKMTRGACFPLAHCRNWQICYERNGNKPSRWNWRRGRASRGCSIGMIEARSRGNSSEGALSSVEGGLSAGRGADAHSPRLQENGSEES